MSAVNKLLNPHESAKSFHFLSYFRFQTYLSNQNCCSQPCRLLDLNNLAKLPKKDSFAKHVNGVPNHMQELIAVCETVTLQTTFVPYSCRHFVAMRGTKHKSVSSSSSCCC